MKFKAARTAILIAFALVMTIGASAKALADTMLVGSNLSNATGGSGLCPNDADCALLKEEFNLINPVEIDTIKVAMGSYLPIPIGAGFSVGLTDDLGTVVHIGEGYLDVEYSTEVFAFENLNIELASGRHYLIVSGENVVWAFAPPISSAAGTLGPTWMCDPTLTCNSGRWQIVPGSHAMEIDGSVITPEPSTWLLFGTGIFGMAGAARRKILRA